MGTLPSVHPLTSPKFPDLYVRSGFQIQPRLMNESFFMLSFSIFHHFLCPPLSKFITPTFVLFFFHHFFFSFLSLSFCFHFTSSFSIFHSLLQSFHSPSLVYLLFPLHFFFLCLPFFSNSLALGFSFSLLFSHIPCILNLSFLLSVYFCLLISFFFFRKSFSFIFCLRMQSATLKFEGTLG